MRSTQQPRNRVFWVGFLGLALCTGMWLVFALLSGAEMAGGGVRGLVRNAPNALPWLVALGVLLLSLRFPGLAGAAFVAMGLATVHFFESYRHAALFLALSLPLLAFGSCLVISAAINRRQPGNAP